MTYVALFLLFVLLVGTGFYFGLRAVYAAARRALGYDDEDPIKKARRIARRVHQQLEASTGSSQTYGTVLTQITDIIDTKLPRLASTRDRLEHYIQEKPRGTIEAEIRQQQAQLERASDPEVRRLIEKNIRLAFERLDTQERITVMRDRTLAQIKNVLLTVESLEDRIVSLRLTDSQADIVPQLEVMMGEVDQLESELKKLRLLE